LQLAPVALLGCLLQVVPATPARATVACKPAVHRVGAWTLRPSHQGYGNCQADDYTLFDVRGVNIAELHGVLQQPEIFQQRGETLYWIGVVGTDRYRPFELVATDLATGAHRSVTGLDGPAHFVVSPDDRRVALHSLVSGRLDVVDLRASERLDVVRPTAGLWTQWVQAVESEPGLAVPRAFRKGRLSVQGWSDDSRDLWLYVQGDPAPPGHYNAWALGQHVRLRGTRVSGFERDDVPQALRWKPWSPPAPKVVLTCDPPG
jgi:hypothetical protein